MTCPKFSFLLQVTLASSNSRHSSLSRYSQRNIATLPIAELGYSHQNWAEVVFQGAIPQPLQPIQGHFLQHPDFQFFAPYKLPVSSNYDLTIRYIVHYFSILLRVLLLSVITGSEINFFF